jgi:major vault protein
MADEDRGRKDRDMVLAPNEWMLVRDLTKGNVDVFVGPCKMSLSNTDQPVVFDDRTKKFQDSALLEAVQTFLTAPEGYYIVLKNPAVGGKQPSGQGKNNTAELNVGRKVNIPGSASFPLWPGQMGKVLKGHHLRSNQYLLVRVYDEDAARKNWKSAVVKPAGIVDPSDLKAIEDAKEAARKDPDFSIMPGPAQADSLTMGQQMIVKGTEVAFFIPPTGVEVVKDDSGNLVREAVTLERLEYCLLRDQNGNKRYEQGPAVVFPEPTEIFSEREVEDKDGKVLKTRKFRAIELNENSGIYIKVISDYEEDGATHKVGEELFITGREQMIYFPREEHAIVKYDSSEIHYGVAIPAGEARYVLDRNTGDVSIVRGPKVFLPDPRTQVITRRILDFKTVSLLYPGNTAAVEHNAKLAGIDVTTYTAAGHAVVAAASSALMSDSRNVIESATIGLALTPGGANAGYASIGDSAQARGLGGHAGRGFSGDAFQRKTQYTEPRTITLPTKYDGAVATAIWPGYAMVLVRKSGERRVVQGPQTVLFEYDEEPQILTLSRGKPKTTDNLLRTAYLLTTANKVSDIVAVETSDFCRLSLKVSYKVNFVGDAERWFSVENYVKFLTDHMRSKLRSATRQIGVEHFYANAEPIVRDTILGKQDGGAGGRSGFTFKENGMHIYDVDVLGVEIENKDIASDLAAAQKEVIKHTLTLATSRRNLEFTKESETIKQQTEEAKQATARAMSKIGQEQVQDELVLALSRLEANAKKERERQVAALAEQQSESAIAAERLQRNKAAAAMEAEVEQVKLEQRKAWLEAEVQAIVEKAKAVSPHLVAALTTFGEQGMVERISEAMAPLAMIQKAGVAEVLGKLLEGTKLGDKLLPTPKNGASSSSQPRA